MNPEILLLALIVGFANWAFRYGPMRFGLGAGENRNGALARFLASTGPAAIATLAVASVLPMVGTAAGQSGTLVAGVGAVVGLWLWRRSVVLATLGGSVAYGAAFALLA
jgi:branched-subunit amino acid transport protein AzlD